MKFLIAIYFLLVLHLWGGNPAVHAQRQTEQTNPILDKALQMARQGALEKALKLLEGQPSTSPGYQLVQGEINLRKGRHSLALKLFQEALTAYEQQGLKESEITALCLSNMGLAYWASGNHMQSLAYHGRALDIRRKFFGDKEEAVAASYNDIGLVYSQDKPGLALEYYEKALAIYQARLGSQHERTANAYLNIGVANSQIGFHGDAVNNIEKALEIHKQLYPNGHPKVAFNYAALGRAYQAMGRGTDVKPYFHNALSIYKRFYGNKHPEIAEIHNLIGAIYQEEGFYDKALVQFQAAVLANAPQFNNTALYGLPNSRDYYNPNAMVISLMLKAQALEQQYFDKTFKPKDLYAALSALQLCDTLIHNIRNSRNNEKDKIALGAAAAEVYEDATRIALAIAEIAVQKKQYRAMAFQFAEKRKSAVLQEAISDANAKSFANIPTSLLEEEQNLKADVAYYEQKIAQKLTPEQENAFRKKLFDANAASQAFILKLEKEYPSYFQLKYARNTPSIAAYQNLLDEATALVSYSIMEKTERLLIFIVTQKQLKIHNVPLGQNFDRNVTGFRNALYYQAKYTYLQTAVSLHTQLFPKPLPKAIKKIVIIPSGRLAMVPFEALLTKQPQMEHSGFAQLPYLLKRYTVSYAYAASLFYQSTLSSQKNTQTGVSLFAPVTFEAATKPLPALPGSSQEAQAIAQAFSDKQQPVGLFLKEKALESTAKSDTLKGYGHLHFATHGVAHESTPELSRIFLGKAADTNEDGSLYAGEIYNLKLNANLVTLSACQTGLGKISKGEGVIGLARALLFAGANNLTVSLWNVADASTAKLMVNFYSAFLNSTQQQGYGVALSQAKQSLIRSEEYADPFYWAPFVLVGQ